MCEKYVFAHVGGRSGRKHVSGGPRWGSGPLGAALGAPPAPQVPSRARRRGMDVDETGFPQTSQKQLPQKTSNRKRNASRTQMRRNNCRARVYRRPVRTARSQGPALTPSPCPAHRTHTAHSTHTHYKHETHNTYNTHTHNKHKTHNTYNTQHTHTPEHT